MCNSYIWGSKIGCFRVLSMKQTVETLSFSHTVLLKDKSHIVLNPIVSFLSVERFVQIKIVKCHMSLFNICALVCVHLNHAYVRGLLVCFLIKNKGSAYRDQTHHTILCSNTLNTCEQSRSKIKLK